MKAMEKAIELGAQADPITSQDIADLHEAIAIVLRGPGLDPVVLEGASPRRRRTTWMRHRPMRPFPSPNGCIVSNCAWAMAA